jgi:predicted PhzF superfamily epimerase YddE/YHI9
MDDHSMTGVLHYSAFTTIPSGGNGAGVILDASALDDGGVGSASWQMLRRS